MRLFLDTEFTNFNLPVLISLGLVAEDGREFYAERNDFALDACSPFVQAQVLPRLGHIPGAACDADTLGQRLYRWLEDLAEPACVLYDYAGDWLLLTEAVITAERLRLPATVQSRDFLPVETIQHPVFCKASASAYSLQWMPHHALADARALRAGWLAWREQIDKA